MYVWVYKFIHAARMHVCMYECTFAWMYVCMNVCMYTQTCDSAHLWVMSRTPSGCGVVIHSCSIQSSAIGTTLQSDRSQGEKLRVRSSEWDSVRKWDRQQWDGEKDKERDKELEWKCQHSEHTKVYAYATDLRWIRGKCCLLEFDQVITREPRTCLLPDR